MGPLDRNPVDLPRHHVRGAVAAARVGGPGRGEPAVDPLGPPQAELQDGIVAGRQPQARRLGGDQRLEVDQVEQGRLQELGDEQGAAHPHQRLLAEDHRPLGHGVEVAAEAQGAEVIQEPRLEERPAVVALDPRQIVEVLVLEPQALHVFDGGLEPAGHGEAAAERVLAEGEMEARPLLRRPRLPIAIGHGELVEIGEEGERIAVDAGEVAHVRRPHAGGLPTGKPLVDNQEGTSGNAGTSGTAAGPEILIGTPFRHVELAAAIRIARSPLFRAGRHPFLMGLLAVRSRRFRDPRRTS